MRKVRPSAGSDGCRPPRLSLHRSGEAQPETLEPASGLEFRRRYSGGRRPTAVYLVLAGQYGCQLRRDGQIVMPFGGPVDQDDNISTIRRDQSGLADIVSVRLAPGESVLVTNDILDRIAPNKQAVASGPGDVGETARTLMQDALIKGVEGNLALFLVGSQQPS